MANDGGSELQQSLLSGQEPSTSGQETHGLAATGKPHANSLLASLFANPARLLLLLWASAKSAVLGVWRLLFGWLSPQPKLSLLQEARLEALVADAAVPFDASNAEHQDLLRELWGAAFPGEPCTSLRSGRWKDMGWQGEDPGTDFRGSGYFGLVNLVDLARRHPATWDALLHKRQGARATWEYPFAVAGLNLTFVLTEVLELQRHRHQGQGQGAGASHVPRGAAARGFLALLGGESGDDAFGDLYCAAFRVLDREWLAMKASYMEFNQVLKRTRQAVEGALASQPASMQALEAKLGLGPEA